VSSTVRSASWPQRARQVLVRCLLAVSAGLFVAGVVVPKIGGATGYTVLTGSMRPDLPPGTLVVVRPIDPESVEVGTVITYQLRSNEPDVVTHRVVATGVAEDGARVFRTRGDSNTGRDRGWVKPVQIRGSLWYSVPYLGYVNNALSPLHREQIVYGLAIPLLGWSLFLFALALREARVRRRSEGAAGLVLEGNGNA
jgi:signal peptidase I